MRAMTNSLCLPGEVIRYGPLLVSDVEGAMNHCGAQVVGGAKSSAIVGDLWRTQELNARAPVRHYSRADTN